MNWALAYVAQENKLIAQCQLNYDLSPKPLVAFLYIIIIFSGQHIRIYGVEDRPPDIPRNTKRLLNLQDRWTPQDHRKRPGEPTDTSQ